MGWFVFYNEFSVFSFGINLGEQELKINVIITNKVIFYSSVFV
jgi:hypothetical protein